MKIEGVRIGEYSPGETVSTRKDSNRITGYIEPDCENPQWILWFTKNGNAVLYTEREKTGAVRGTPIHIKAHLGRIAKMHNQKTPYFNAQADLVIEAPTKVKS